MGLRRLTSLRPGARAHAITGILRLRSLMLLVAQMLAQLSVQRRLQHVFRQLAEQSARATSSTPSERARSTRPRLTPLSRQSPIFPYSLAGHAAIVDGRSRRVRSSPLGRCEKEWEMSGLLGDLRASYDSVAHRYDEDRWLSDWGQYLKVAQDEAMRELLAVGPGDRVLDVADGHRSGDVCAGGVRGEDCWG